jgi:hypothetical protein
MQHLAEGALHASALSSGKHQRGEMAHEAGAY